MFEHLASSRWCCLGSGDIFTVVLNLPDAASFNTASHVVVTPNHKTIPLLLQNCHLATVMNRNADICFPMVLGGPCEITGPSGVATHRLRGITGLKR